MTTGVRNYRDLEVWQYAMDWTVEVYGASALWPQDERFGLISQVRRAAVSVASNIAEGAARRTTGEFMHFVGMARASLAEAETQILIAERLGYFGSGDHNALMTTANRISRMLRSLASTLASRKGGS